jgi:hypothetical protein
MAEIKLNLDAEALAREALAKMDGKAIDKMVKDAVKIAVRDACVQAVKESTDLVPRIKQAAHEALDKMLGSMSKDASDGTLAEKVASDLAVRLGDYGNHY